MPLYKEQCFDDNENLICELEEHTHTEKCLSEYAEGDTQQQQTDENKADNTEQTPEESEQETEEQAPEDNEQDKTEEQAPEDDEQDKTEEQAPKDDEQDKTEEQTPEDNEQEIEQQIKPKRAMRAARTATDCNGNHDSWTKLTTDNLTIASSGNYYLDEADNTLEIPTKLLIEGEGVNVTLCLNGNTLEYIGSDKTPVIQVGYGATLTLCDCEGNGVITGGTDVGGIYVVSSKNDDTTGASGTKSSTLIMNGGNIRDNISTIDENGNGAGVYVTDSTFTMNGGTITNNEAGSNGGGVYVNNGSKFTMNNGTISGNVANDSGGGVAVMNYCTFTMNGGQIGGDGDKDTDYNLASVYGGGVYVNGGTFNMKGGKIGGTNENGANLSFYDGGGVYINGQYLETAFTMTGGTIDNNAALYNEDIPYYGSGGGVFITGEKATFTMNKGQINNNIAILGGGGVAVDSGATFTMESGTLDSNGAMFMGGGVFVNTTIATGSEKKSSFQLNNGTISNNTVDDGYGGGVYVLASNFTMEGGNIDHNIVGRDQDAGAGLGGGVYIRYAEDGSFNPITGGEGTFTMSGGTIGSNKAEIYGGGVYVNGSEFTMNGSSSINKNEAYHGAGVFIDSGANIGTDAKFTMNDSSVISENIASGYAGGVYVNDSNFIMNGNSSINKNKANAGASVAGGVYVQSANVIMNNNSIINENETEGSGGGVAIISGSGSTFAMNDNSAISKNKASAGGAVAMRNDSKFTMNDNSSINENTANVGSAVHMSGDSEFTMNESSSIINNIVKIFGGSVYFSGKVFNVSGAVVVADNTGTDDTSSNVNLSSNGKTVTVTEALTEGAAIGVTPYSPPTEGNPVTIAQGNGTTYEVTNADKAYFTSDDTDYIVDFDATSEAVVLRLPYTYTVTFDNNDGSTSPTTTQITVTEGQKVDETKIPADPTRDGYAFVGWYKEAACTTPFDFETEITENTTVYAKWGKIVTVTFDTDGGSTVAPQKIAEGQKAKEPETIPIKDGFIFAGWYKEADCTNKFNFETEIINADTKVYAKWAEKVTITFQSNGGSAVDNLDMPKGGTAERPTDPTRNGYIFVGWYSDEELTTGYDFTQAVTTDITLYAKWQKAPNNSSKKYSISGTVKYQNGVAIQNAVVKANSITAVTDEQGKYLLSNLSSGVYDIIATITVDGSEKTASKKVSLISGNVNDADIIFTIDDVSTEIKLPSGGSSGELDTGDIIVKGLDEEAKKHSEPDASVKLTLTIQSEDNDSNQEAKKAIQKAAKQSKLEGFDVSLEKAVTKNGVTTTTKIEQTQTVLELIVPFDTSDKQNVSVYRYYDGKASQLKKLNSEPTVLQDGTFWIEKDCIHIYIDKMAYYAIVYDKKSSEKPTSNGRTGTWVKDDKTDNEDNTKNETPVIPNTKPDEKIPQMDYSNCTKDSNCPLTKFVDMNVNQWYHDGVHYCIEKGLMSGTSSTTFDPNANATRAMIVAILWRIENQPMVNETIAFTDVQQNAYYKDAVCWAVSVGIISGYDEKTFAPDDNITREQMASILYRYTQYKGKDVSVAQNMVLNYEDINDISSYALEAMKWACGTGVINGTSSTQLSPKGNATRAQVAQMLKVYLNQ